MAAYDRSPDSAGGKKSICSKDAVYGHRGSQPKLLHNMLQAEADNRDGHNY